MVYEFILPTKVVLKPSAFDIYHTFPTTRSQAKTRPFTVSNVNLLVSCHQIHYEAAEIFYTTNVFRVRGTPVISVEDLDLEFGSPGKFNKIPVVPRMYAQFVRHVEYGPHDVNKTGLTFPMIECLTMTKMWPALSNIKLKIKIDARSVGYIYEWLEAPGSREQFVEKLVLALREICRMQELRIPKGLDIEVAVRCEGNVRLNADVTMLYDAIKRVKALKRM
jgi:hypothetical protein